MKAFSYLKKIKETYSKVHSIKYRELKLQPFLVLKHSDLTIKEKQFAVAARTQMLDLKTNFKVGAADTRFRRCQREEEMQEQLLQCSGLSSDSSPVQGVPCYSDMLGERYESFKKPSAPNILSAAAIL